MAILNTTGWESPSSKSIFEAAVVTRDRALQGRQDAIDVLQRILDQMGDDPLVVKTKENLLAILEHPEVITDEVFNNIMSKTGEVLDSNYDTQVQEVLGAARAKGVSGPALQITLQRAKEGRAVAIAGAYRDALISRAESGLKTNMDAITSATNLLNNLFGQQRVASESLANVMRETVEEPFRNYGPDYFPQEAGIPPEADASGQPGGGGRGALPMNFLPQDPNWGKMDSDMLARAAALRGEDINGNPLPSADATTYGNQPSGQPGTKASSEAATAAYEKAKADADVAAIKAQYGSKEDQKGASLAGTYVLPDGTYTNIPPNDVSGYEKDPVTGLMRPYDTSTGYRTSAQPASTQPAIPSVQPQPTSSVQSAISKAMAPISSIGSTIAGYFGATPAIAAPQSVLALPTRIQANLPYTQGAAYGPNYQESTISPVGGAPISAGGGAPEAARGEQLVAQYGAPSVIGTTAGYGVRDTDVAGYGGAGTAYPTATGSQSAGATLASKYAGPVDYSAAQAAADTKKRQDDYAALMAEAAAYSNAQKYGSRGMMGVGGSGLDWVEVYRKKRDAGEIPGIPAKEGPGTAIETTSGSGVRHA